MTFYRARLGDDASDAQNATAILGQLQKWSTTGFYTADQINTVYNAVRAAGQAINDAIQKYIDTGTVAVPPFTDASVVSSIPSSLVTIQRSVMDAYSTQYIPYLRAAALAQGGVVNAPGFARTVTDSVKSFQIATAAFNAIHTFTDNASSVWRAIGGLQVVLQKVAGVIWDTTKKIAVTVPDTIGTLLKVAKWGAVALAVVWVVEEAKKIQGRA